LHGSPAAAATDPRNSKVWAGMKLHVTRVRMPFTKLGNGIDNNVLPGAQIR